MPGKSLCQGAGMKAAGRLSVKRSDEVRQKQPMCLSKRFKGLLQWPGEGEGEGNSAGYYHASKNGEDMISGGPHHQLLAKTRKRLYREGETPRQPDFLS